MKNENKLSKIITKCNCRFGAPMGRCDKGRENLSLESKTIYDNIIHLDGGGYDNGSAYWGIRNLNEVLRVCYNSELSFKYFYTAIKSRPTVKQFYNFLVKDLYYIAHFEREYGKLTDVSKRNFYMAILNTAIHMVENFETYKLDDYCSDLTCTEINNHIFDMDSVYVRFKFECTSIMAKKRISENNWY